MVVAAVWAGAAGAAVALAANGPATPAATRAADTLPFAFRERAFPVSVIDLEHRFYSGNKVLPRQDTGVHDAAGVRMRRLHGVLVDLPRLQATYGLLNLNTYRLSGDVFYLERALAQARRLVSNAVAAGDAWFIPTPIRCHRHGVGSEPIEPPYFSALAQGRTLLFFSRLAAVTAETRWRTAADRVFAAFVRVGARGGPQVTLVDDRGYVWLQEWPWAGWQPDDTYNGHISAAFGIYEYYCLSGDARARSLFRGAATTALEYAADFRQPGWVSHYCLAHLITNPNYHRIHVQQLLTLYRLTHDPGFARYADLFQGDYPAPDVSGTARIDAGVREVYRVTGGVPVPHSAVAFKAPERVRVTQRLRLRGHGIFLHIAGGRLSGLWLEEIPGRVYVQGAVVPLSYWPARRVELSPGRDYMVRTFGEDGSEVARAVVAAGTDLRAGRGAVVDGFHSVRLSGGAVDGYWLRLGRGVTVF